MTRIVAGSAGGRTLAVPAQGTRPTSDRVREAMFSRLEHYGVVRGARVLDLFAGSGALGLEAASRGATRVVLVERAKPAAEVARANAVSLGFTDVVVVTERAERYAALTQIEPWDLVFIDPPYDIDEAIITEILAALSAPGTLAPDGVVVVERPRRAPEPEWPGDWEMLALKKYGDTNVWFAGPSIEDVPA